MYSLDSTLLFINVAAGRGLNTHGLDGYGKTTKGLSRNIRVDTKTTCRIRNKHC